MLPAQSLRKNRLALYPKLCDLPALGNHWQHAKRAVTSDRNDVQRRKSACLWRRHASGAGTTQPRSSHAPATGLWSATGRADSPRFYDTATLLLDGRPPVTGGFYELVSESMPRRELDNSATGQWSGDREYAEMRATSQTAILAEWDNTSAAGWLW